MIEIERKIDPNPSFLNYIKKHAVFISQKSIHDTYYDTDNYHYTTQNIWLRERGKNTFELKRLIKGFDHTIDRYEEILESERILEILKVPDLGNFVLSIFQAKIFPFANILTNREKYRMSRFTLDIDTADFGEITYPIVEIECLVEQEEEIFQAEQEMNDFLKQFQIDLSTKPQAKLMAYLLKYKPDHYKALQKAGVIR